MFNASNPFAFPKSSFNQKVTSPSTDPDEGEQWTVCFGIDWLPSILGALDQLLLPTTWEGDADSVQLAQDRAALLKDLFGNPSTCASVDTPAPFWDDAEDSDDEAPPGEQIWYGEIISGSFHEVVENWTIAGFIALAGAPAAAVYFLTIAPRFRLAWRRGDIGGIVRIFIDSEDYGTVDTANDTADIITMDIIPTAEADTHEILLVKEG